jgi:hypothetical protein
MENAPKKTNLSSTYMHTCVSTSAVDYKRIYEWVSNVIPAHCACVFFVLASYMGD